MPRRRCGQSVFSCRDPYRALPSFSGGTSESFFSATRLFPVLSSCLHRPPVNYESFRDTDGALLCIASRKGFPPSPLRTHHSLLRHVRDPLISSFLHMKTALVSGIQSFFLPHYPFQSCPLTTSCFGIYSGTPPGASDTVGRLGVCSPYRNHPAPGRIPPQE